MHYYVYDLLGMQSFLWPRCYYSTPDRVFMLFGELLECMGHHFLEWYVERKIKYWQRGTDAMEQDISWTEFYDNFRAWLFYADKEYEAGLDHLESNPATPIYMSTLDVAVQDRSKQLYCFLIGSLRGRLIRILKGVSDRNGYEAWKQLLAQYQPRTRARSISMLSALMNFPAFNKNQTFVEQIRMSCKPLHNTNPLVSLPP